MKMHICNMQGMKDTVYYSLIPVGTWPVCSCGTLSSLARRARVVSRARVPEAGTSSSRDVGETPEPLCASPPCAQPWSCAAPCQSQLFSGQKRCGARFLRKACPLLPSFDLCFCLFGPFVSLFSPKKYGVYLSQYLSSPFIAARTFVPNLVLFLLYFCFVSTAEDPLLIVAEISFNYAAM